MPTLLQVPVGHKPHIMSHKPFILYIKASDTYSVVLNINILCILYIHSFIVHIAQPYHIVTCILAIIVLVSFFIEKHSREEPTEEFPVYWREPKRQNKPFIDVHMIGCESLMLLETLTWSTAYC